MTDETRIALKNLLWLAQAHPDNVSIDWHSDTLVYGDGGCLVGELLRPGFTPATNDE